MADVVSSAVRGGGFMSSSSRCYLRRGGGAGDTTTSVSRSVSGVRRHARSQRQRQVARTVVMMMSSSEVSSRRRRSVTAPPLRANTKSSSSSSSSSSVSAIHPAETTSSSRRSSTPPPPRPARRNNHKVESSPPPPPPPRDDQSIQSEPAADGDDDVFVPKKMRIVFVSMECAPFSKVGGMADVVNELPDALARRGHRVVTVSPWHEEKDEEEEADNNNGDIITTALLRMRLPWRFQKGGRVGAWANVQIVRANQVRQQEQDDYDEANSRQRKNEIDSSSSSSSSSSTTSSSSSSWADGIFPFNFFQEFTRRVESTIRQSADNDHDPPPATPLLPPPPPPPPPPPSAQRLFVRSACFARGGFVYGPSPSHDYGDNDLRMLLLCRAALKIPEHVLFPSQSSSSTSLLPPAKQHLLHEPVVIMLNDFHAAPIALLLRFGDRGDDECASVPRGSQALSQLSPTLALLMHNAAHRGSFHIARMESWGIRDVRGAIMAMTRMEEEEKQERGEQQSEQQNPLPSSSSPPVAPPRRLQWLLGAASLSDAMFTVSPTYAKEVTTNDPSLLQGRNNLVGIVNGISPTVWNPSQDTALHMHGGEYDISSVDEGKQRHKASIWHDLFVAPSSSPPPLFAFVGRLDVQKGVDVLVDVINDLLDAEMASCDDPHHIMPHDVPSFAVVVLGTGDASIAASLRRLVSRSRKSRWIHVAFRDEFDESLARRLYAAADFTLVPSRWEPCGIVQMLAMRYGSLPVVANTGGLVDTVPRNVGIFCRAPSLGEHFFTYLSSGGGCEGYRYRAYASSTSSWFDGVFGGSPSVRRGDASSLWLSMRTALAMDERELRDRRQRAMTTDVSWDYSAAAWESHLAKTASSAASSAGVVAGVRGTTPV
ncbi:hypothetical protein PPROV_000498800 [Pycnococcus provasolii]|uniref:Starch synthase, chloroplastic/amyloplastic n=1 Tax=Pycnococcus provasolii TaxID=41880 RepID=A0A830HL34_9CHLO|nr:hypothetical protein PPROV_000498800 [Pycnococcus provasolii]